MRNLMNKLGLIAGLGVASTMYTGCTTPEGFFSLNPEHATPAQRQAVQQAVVGGLAGYGIMNHGINSGNSAQVVLGQAVMDGAMQQPPQNTVVVNNPQQPIYNGRLVPANSPQEVQLNIPAGITIHEFHDINGNGIADVVQERGNQKYSFTEGAPFLASVPNPGAETIYVRFVIKDKNAIVVSSPFIETHPYMAATLTVRSGSEATRPGEYEITALDNEGNMKGRKMFTVAPATLSHAMNQHGIK